MSHKPQEEYVASLFGRIIGGMFFGSVVGLLASAAVMDVEAPQGDRLMQLAMFVMAGVVIFTPILVAFGSYNIRGLPKAVLGGMVVGTLVGILCACALNICFDVVVRPFKFKGLSAEWVLYPAGIGAASGALVGAAIALLNRWRNRHMNESRSPSDRELQD